MPTKLSKRLIDSLEPRASEYVEWDTLVPGLGVRVRKTGLKTFIYRYRDRSTRKQRKLNLGKVSIVTLEEARLSAREYGTQIARGEDPADQRFHDTHSKTTAVVAERFLEEHVRLKRKPTTYDQYELLLRRYLLPSLGDIPMDELTKSDLARMHSSHASNAVSANRALAVFGSLHSYAIGIGAIEDRQSPAKGIERFKEVSRERFLTPEELQRLGAALLKAETLGIEWQVKAPPKTQKHLPKKRTSTFIDPGAAAALRLLILTGCRLRALEIDQIDFFDAELALSTDPPIPTLPLSEAALRVLAYAVGRRDCGPVFSDADQGFDHVGPNSGILKRFKTRLMQVEVARFDPRRIRHSIIEALSDTGQNPSMVMEGLKGQLGSFLQPQTRNLHPIMIWNEMLLGEAFPPTRSPKPSPTSINGVWEGVEL